MSNELLAEWRRGVAVRGVAGAFLLAVPVAVAAIIGFGSSLSGVVGGLSEIATGPDRAPASQANPTTLSRAVSALPPTVNGGGGGGANGPNNSGGIVGPGGSGSGAPAGGGSGGGGSGNGSQTPGAPALPPINGNGAGNGVGNAVNGITNAVGGLLPNGGR